MTPNRLQGRSTTLARELDALVRLVRDEALARQPADHPADRRGGDAQRGGNLIRAGCSVPRLELEDRLEIILDRRRELGNRSLRSHLIRCTLGALGSLSPRTSRTGTRDRCRTSLATLP